MYAIRSYYVMAIEKGNAIPVLDAYESVRLVDGVGSIAYDRDRVKLVQTPQVFDSKVLMIAYNQKFSPLFTDDASVVEANGGIINLVEGNRENIKLTTPMDLILAEAFLSKGRITSYNVCYTKLLRSTVAQQEPVYHVLIATNMGNVKVKLYNETPEHRDNFLKLIGEKHFDGTLFYRVVENFVIQGRNNFV